MDFVCNLPFFSIMLLMFAGIITPVFGSKNARRASLGAIFVAAVLSAAVLAYTLRTGESFTYRMGHFPAPFGNEIRAGSLEALMAFAVCAVAALSLSGSGKTTGEDIPKGKRNLFFIMINMLLASILVLVYTNDIFTAYVFIEINTLAACAIVMSKPGGETIVATIRYLIMSLLGSGLFLLATSLLYGLTGHLLMETMRPVILHLMETGEYALPLIVVIGLFSVSMAIKSSLFPFHSWLPDAHGSATTAASSILSGLVLKGYIILLIKLFYRVFTIEVVEQLHILPVLLVLGLLGMIVGSLQAMRESNIKRMIAYSSVAQIGYIYMGIGMGSAAGMVAACFHILAHMVTKPLLFTAAGGLINVSDHKKDFEDLRGAAWRDPLGGAAFICGALSMIGIPLFCGFISKYYFAAASIVGRFHAAPVLVTLVLSTVLNALYYLPAIGIIYSRHQEEAPMTRVVSTPLGYKAALIIFMALNFFLGIFSQPVLHAIEHGLQIFA